MRMHVSKSQVLPRLTCASASLRLSGDFVRIKAADAQILAARAGAALIVARRNHTLHEELSMAMQNFVQSGVGVLGSVMNEY